MMKHCGTVAIETERLLLRRFRLKDAQAMFDNWASDPLVTRYMKRRTSARVVDVKKHLRSVCVAYRKKNCYNWCIVDRATDTPIGNIGVFEFFETLGSARVGYCLSRTYWGRGIMPEALRAVMQLMFEHVGVRRLECVHQIDNLQSGRVMSKCGMLQEGVLRKAYRNHCGEFFDVVQYAILDTDYAALDHPSPARIVRTKKARKS